MSALAINSFLSNQMGVSTNHNFATPATKTTENSIIDRKHYSDRGGHHYSSHGYSGHSSGHQSKKKKSRSIALTALTLLAFLFFLNILQQCLQEQMDQMNPQVVIMQARIQAAREAEAKEKEAEERIGEAEKETTTTSPITEEHLDIPSFSKADSLYRYEKVHHVPVRLKSIDNGRQ